MKKWKETRSILKELNMILKMKETRSVLQKLNMILKVINDYKDELLRIKKLVKEIHKSGDH